MRDFDPFAWGARLLPEPLLHRLIRAGGAGLFALFLVLRVRQYPDFLLKPLWAAETAIYAALLLAYLSRTDPVSRSRGTREILVPLAGAVLPFALLLTPPSPAMARNPAALRTVFWWLTASSVLTVWGLLALRRCFSITVEARALVTAGPFRLVRHPVYLGEMLSAAGVAYWRRSWASLGLLLLFVLLQMWRARMEEAKLRAAFPAAYAAWAERSWWLWRG